MPEVSRQLASIHFSENQQFFISGNYFLFIIALYLPSSFFLSSNDIPAGSTFMVHKKRVPLPVRDRS